MYRINLPFPPSVNHYWRHVGNRVLISKKGRDYRATVSSLIRNKRIKTLEGELIVEIQLIPPDHRRRDIDNSLKAMLDSLEFGGVYFDDSQIVRLLIEKWPADKERSGARVIILPVPAPIDTPAIRTCLRCGAAFESEGSANRICAPCTIINSQFPEGMPIHRGRKFHNGELMD